MLLEIPPEYSVLSFMGLIEKRSILTLYERFQEQNYKYRNREFRRRGYYIDTAGKDTKRIARYIKRRLDEKQLTMANI